MAAGWHSASSASGAATQRNPVSSSAMSADASLKLDGADRWNGLVGIAFPAPWAYGPASQHVT